MGAAVEDIHHRDGQDMGIDTADIAVEGQSNSLCSSFGNSQRGAQDGIGAQFGFIGGAIQMRSWPGQCPSDRWHPSQRVHQQWRVLTLSTAVRTPFPL